MFFSLQDLNMQQNLPSVATEDGFTIAPLIFDLLIAWNLQNLIKTNDRSNPLFLTKSFLSDLNNGA